MWEECAARYEHTYCVCEANSCCAVQHFMYIYIENQYFLGSSFNWRNYKTLGTNNLIPMEIALKIAN